MNTSTVIKPVITEKTLQLANDQNVYTFFVDHKATRTQVKFAIEELFEVEVERVNTLLSPSKRRRVGKKRTPKLSTVNKKALVKIKQGQTIDLFDITS